MEHTSNSSDRPSGEERARMHTSGIALAATGLDPEVRAFAEQQLFNTTDETIQATAQAPTLSLERVVKALHDSEINVGFQSLCFCGLRVWLGDPLNGITASASLGPGEAGWDSLSAVATWLHRAALRTYPESQYARQAAGQ